MYKDYVTRIADTLQKTLAFAVSEDPGIRSRPLQLALPPMPPVSAPPAEPLRLAVGQPLLVRSEGKTPQTAGAVQLGVVREGRHVALPLAGGDVELEYDSCVQAVLPWSPTAEKWDEAAFIRDAQALPALAERAQRACTSKFKHSTRRRYASMLRSCNSIACTLRSCYS